jgi:hypothetical protein
MPCCRTSTACAARQIQPSRPEAWKEEEIPAGHLLSQPTQSLRSPTRHAVPRSPLDYWRRSGQTHRPLKKFSARQLRTWMLLKASHIATAISATVAEFNRPSDWRFVGACARLSSSKPIYRAEQGSIRTPE